MSKSKDGKETPLMKQYNAIKAKHPGALLLFRVGDFYETFGEDAIIASKVLDIVLTKRANGAASHIELRVFHTIHWIITFPNWSEQEIVSQFVISSKTPSRSKES